MKIGFLPITLGLLGSILLPPAALGQDTPAVPPTVQSSQVTNWAIVTNPDSLGMAGFPTRAIKWEPRLAAVYQLQPEQEAALKSAWQETVEQAKLEAAQNPDPAQAKALQKAASKDFTSRRDSILTEEQITLNTTIQTLLIESEKDRGRFLDALKPRLTAEQLDRYNQAGP